MQTFTAPITTNYKIECWGAQGGDINNTKSDIICPGAKGGYTSGKLDLSKQAFLYVYIGQHPNTFSWEGDIGSESFPKGYNGGGSGTHHDQIGNSGGGATDVRLTSGIWNDFSSLKSRIMVAAGGAGAGYYISPGAASAGGGLIGFDGQDPGGPDVYKEYRGTGGTQTYAGDCQSYEQLGATTVKDSKLYQGGFGYGGDSSLGCYWGGSGGGGGYYGGGASCRGHINGGGGSSFISGYTGCDAIAESSTEDNIIHTGQPNHYSGYVFSNSVMIDGGSTMPKPGGGTETGHSGNGYAIFSWISPSL